MRQSSRRSWPSRCPTPKSAPAPISSWIAGKDSSRRARKCVIFSPRVGKYPARFRPDNSKADARNRPRHRNHRPRSGPGPPPDRVGCVELINRIPTGATFHAYLNPEREMPAEAFAIHGLSTEFLQRQAALPRGRRRFPCLHRRRAAGDPQCQFRPRLPQCRAQAHRARADRARAADRHAAAGATQAPGRAPTGSTILCARYGIDNSRRSKHGALLDAEILAEVYVELIGARQAQLGLAARGRARAQPAATARRLARAAGAACRRASAKPSAPRTATSWRPGRGGDLAEVSDRRTQ